MKTKAEMLKAERLKWLGFCFLLSTFCFPCLGQGLDENRVVDAIWHAEGGTNTVYPYGVRLASGRRLQASEARERCLALVHGSLVRWAASGKHGDPVRFISLSYCPVSDKRDVRHLNANWARNVRWFYEHAPARTE